jgi:hypothetical protein
MGRKAPGAEGGVAAGAGGVAVTGVDAGGVLEEGTVCDCEGPQASKLMHATDMKVSLKQGDFNA